MKHMDNFETYPNLSKQHSTFMVTSCWPRIGKFLTDNYWQALDILNGESALWKAMADLEVTDTKVFGDWLIEQWEYLEGLVMEPIQEMQEMEYYQKLVNLMFIFSFLWSKCSASQFWNEFENIDHLDTIGFWLQEIFILCLLHR